MSIGGLIYGPEFHYLDHLAPLCALLGIPLIVTEDAIALQAEKFYPDLQILHWPELETPEKLVFHFTTIFTCTPRPLFDEVFFFAQALQNKKVKTIWCPHGNSDKGRTTPFMESLGQEESLLTYGKRMEDFLQEKGVFGKTIRIGNYRLAYYEKHKLFYERLLQEIIPPGKKVLLYAPTWQDRENNSSFPTLWPFLLQGVPSGFSLIVKLHPHLYLQYPDQIEELKREAAHLHILENFPPIYPILAHTDLYMGDISSIGYDFLAFKRPLLLLSSKKASHPSCHLAQAGKLLPPSEYSRFFHHCAHLLGTETPSSCLYEETFAPFHAEAWKLAACLYN